MCNNERQKWKQVVGKINTYFSSKTDKYTHEMVKWREENSNKMKKKIHKNREKKNSE